MNNKLRFYNKLFIGLLCFPNLALASIEQNFNFVLLWPVFLILMIVGVGLWFLRSQRRTNPRNRVTVYSEPDDKSISSNDYEPVLKEFSDKLEIYRKGFLLLESHLEQLKTTVNGLKPLKEKVYQVELRSSDAFIENRINDRLAKTVTELVTAEISRVVKSESFQAEINRVVQQNLSDTIQAEVNRAVQQNLSDTIQAEVNRVVQQNLSDTIQAEVSRTVQQSLSDSIAAQISDAVNQSLTETDKHLTETSFTNSISIDADIDDDVSTVPLYSADNQLIDKIKTALLKISAVDEVQLNDIDTAVDAGTFVIHVMTHALKHPITNYQRLNETIAKVTDSKLSLIIPTNGDEIRPTEHQVVLQQPVTKGKINVIAGLVRPGIKCDNVIRRKAEVIESI
jgi:hypothetical protein